MYLIAHKDVCFVTVYKHTRVVRSWNVSFGLQKQEHIYMLYTRSTNTSLPPSCSSLDDYICKYSFETGCRTFYVLFLYISISIDKAREHAIHL